MLPTELLGSPRSPLRSVWIVLGMGVLADSDASGCSARAQPGRSSWHLPLAGTVFGSLRARGEPRSQQPSEPGVLLAAPDTPSEVPPRANSRGSWPAGAGRSCSRGGDVAGTVVPPPMCGWRLKTWLWEMSHRRC